MNDLISRQAALNIKFSGGINEDGILYVPFKEVINCLITLPSAQKTGKWIYTPTELLGYVCSECGKGCCGFAYCPNCGAKMDGGKDDV